MSMFTLTSRGRRYSRLLVAALILWSISAKYPLFFFRLGFFFAVDNEPSAILDERSPSEELLPLASDAFQQYAVHSTELMKKATGRHKYRQDGLVEVNPEGPHPIFGLMKRAEKAWSEKLRKASASLDEAVEEYRRRYRRNPPKGFDQWWEYVQTHDVQLPDEYDQIYHDLEPFWGLEPSYLMELQAERESKVDSYTIGKNSEGKLQVLKTAFREGRYDQLIKGSEKILEYLGDIEDLLPSFRATFSPHDNPNLLTDHLIKSTLLEAASTNSYLGKQHLPQIHHLGWRSACDPDSPARQMETFNLDGPPPSKPKKTFIHNHRQTMDPCLHPNLFWKHGQFLSHHAGPDPQRTMIPEFSSCTTSIHHDIRIPTPYGWVEDIYPRSDDPDFDEKEDERLLWRGTNTGIHHGPRTRWRSAHRDVLVKSANEVNGTVEFLVPGYEDQPVGAPRTARKARINPAMMDVAFVREPSQCETPTCKIMEQIYEYKKLQNIKAAGNYKYVLDIDGNGWSGRFKRLITSNSLIFKSTIYPEWFTDRIAPWVHYIPVQVDLSDFYDSLIFFRGDSNGEGAHEELGRMIALQGREWSKKFWRREDLVSYFFRLFLEYARLMSLDREAMTYQGEGELVLERWSKKEAPIEDAILH